MEPSYIINSRLSPGLLLIKRVDCIWEREAFAVGFDYCKFGVYMLFLESLKLVKDHQALQYAYKKVSRQLGR